MGNPRVANLDLAVRRLPDGSYEADLTLELPASARRADLAYGRPVPLEPAALIAASADPEAYGRLLTAQLFADQELRDAWQRARTLPDAAGLPLRLRLGLDPRAEELHALLWETLCEPGSARPIALGERVRLSRYLGAADTADIPAEAPPPAVVVAVASPSDLAAYGLAPVDAPAEIAPIRAALADIPHTLLAEGAAGRATLAAITAALRDGAAVLYLVCHGTIVEATPYLWLESSAGGSDRIAADELVGAIAALSVRPRLIILAACRSGGDGHVVRAALAPRLVRAGVPAVIGAQGDLPMAQVADALPVLLRELRRDGQIDRALAVARAALRRHPDWWRLALWMNLHSGQIWAPPAAPALARPADASPEAAFRCRHLRLSFLWAETFTSGARRSPAVDLGGREAYSAAYDAIPQGGELELADGVGLRRAWLKPRGERFWASYLNHDRLSGITGRQAFKSLVPLRIRLPWQVGLSGIAGAVELDGFGFPHGIACAVTVRHTDELDADALIDLALMLRRARAFTLHPAPQGFDGTLVALADAALGELARLTAGDAAAPRQGQIDDPWSLATIISGSGAAPALPIVEGGPIHRTLEALTLWGRLVEGAAPAPLAAARIPTGTEKAQAGDLLYGHDRARAVWLPRAFLQTQPIAALGCYHRNLLAAALQVESLGGLIRQAAAHLARGHPLDGPQRARAQRAADALSRLYLGDATTYRTRSARRHLLDNRLLPPLNAVRQSLSLAALPDDPPL